MWIRSQDREILIYAKDGVKLTPSGSSITAVGFNIILGCYPTKEKALKVLDMIQQNMERLKFAEINPYANLSYNVIFEMPSDWKVRG